MIKNDCVYYEFLGNKRQDILLMSDVHFDSPECDRKLFKRLLNEALERNAKIMFFGDFFDMMGGKYDPRTNKGHIRIEYQVADYFDEVIRDAAKFLEPYKNNIVFFGMGNHEYSVVKRHEFNPLRQLVRELNIDADLGNYTGYMKLFYSGSTKGNGKGYDLYWTHGSGGNAPVTKGMIGVNRKASAIDADIFVSGHIHQGWVAPHTRMKLNSMGNIEYYDQTHIQLGTFKDQGEWESSKGFNPPTKGGCWLKFTGGRIDNVRYITERAC